jgi:fatty acid/phospholipid biosynthesis enzyme|tara:strand:- start:708 stop:902 length:195 start_codon:yes stop_codon:yes gene_type:complete
MPFKFNKNGFNPIEQILKKEKERISKFLSEEEFRKIQIEIIEGKVVIKGEETSLEKIRKNMPSL